jgi:hypothetical protein
MTPYFAFASSGVMQSHSWGHTEGATFCRKQYSGAGAAPAAVAVFGAEEQRVSEQRSYVPYASFAFASGMHVQP